MGRKNGNGGTYDVGYGKPPKHTQWPKGVSGNPAGKKVKADSFADKLKKIAGEEILVTKNGAPVAMSNEEAMMYKAFLMAQSGNAQFFKVLTKELLGAEAPQGPPPFEASDADLEVLETEAQFRELIESVQAQVQSADNHEPEETGGPDDPEDTF